MRNIKVINLSGDSRDVAFKVGDSLMEVLREADYEEIQAMCGGCCSCATCHVHIVDQSQFKLAPIEEDEELLISMTDNFDEHASRLSCQISLSEEQSGMTVQIVATD